MPCCRRESRSKYAKGILAGCYRPAPGPSTERRSDSATSCVQLSARTGRNVQESPGTRLLLHDARGVAGSRRPPASNGRLVTATAGPTGLRGVWYGPPFGSLAGSFRRYPTAAPDLRRVPPHRCGPAEVRAVAAAANRERTIPGSGARSLRACAHGLEREALLGFRDECDPGEANDGACHPGSVSVHPEPDVPGNAALVRGHRVLVWPRVAAVAVPRACVGYREVGYRARRALPGTQVRT